MKCVLFSCIVNMCGLHKGSACALLTCKQQQPQAPLQGPLHERPHSHMYGSAAAHIALV